MQKSITITKCHCDECGEEFTSNDVKRFAKLSSGFIESVGGIDIQFVAKKRKVTLEDPVTICERCTVKLLNAALKSIDELNKPEVDEDELEDD